MNFQSKGAPTNGKNGARQFPFTLLPEHRAEVEAAAAASGMNMTAFIRQAALEAARRVKREIPTGQPLHGYGQTRPTGTMPSLRCVEPQSGPTPDATARADLITDIRQRVAAVLEHGPFTLGDLADHADIDAYTIQQFAAGFVGLTNAQLRRLAALIGPYILGPDLERLPGLVGGLGVTGEGIRSRRKRLTTFRSLPFVASNPTHYAGPSVATASELQAVAAAARAAAASERHEHPHLPGVFAIRRETIMRRSGIGSRALPAMDQAQAEGWLIALDPRDLPDRFGLTQAQGWLRFHNDKAPEKAS